MNGGKRINQNRLYVFAAAGQKIGTLGPGVKGVDPDAEGIVNGVSVFEFNLDTLKDDEKPWRKPGNYAYHIISYHIIIHKTLIS